MIQTLPLERVLFADSSIVVIDKNHDLLSVPGKGEDKQDCLWRRVQQSHPTARIVHRLDYATSGVMVLALDADSHRNLSMQFQNRQTAKRYQAVVSGLVRDDEGLVDQPLRCDWENRPLQIVDPEQGKPAQTRWQVIKRESDRTRLWLHPITGRSHQLRVHMQFIGHPILGDRFYANVEETGKSERLLLHAETLAFQHPLSMEQMSFNSPTPF
ncbi:MAG: RluA family pseudouridine synthase [Amphritea sp.]